MRRAGNILGARAVLEGKHRLCDHFAGVGANDVCAKDAVSLRLGKDLDEALRVEVGLRARVRREAELANLVLDTLRLEFLLGLADPGDLGVRVYNGGDSSVVDVTVATLDELDSGNTCENRLIRAGEGMLTPHPLLRPCGPTWVRR